MKLFLLTLITCASFYCLGQDTTYYTLRFPSGKSGLTQEQIKLLDSLTTALDDPLSSFLYYIQGHTDNIGDRPYNVRLSEKRCQSVRKYLLKKGVDENKISFEEFGFDAPVATNETETGRADNRRTTLTIITNIPLPDWEIKPQLFDVHLKNQTIITTKNGCKIIVPEDAFELPEVNPLPGKIELEVIEYDNPAYFIASGIPMSYNASGKLFMYHSEEMLRIQAFHGTTPLQLKDGVKITLNCRKVDSLYETGFYKFNLQEEKWFEEEKAKTTVEAIVEKKPEESPEKDLKEEPAKAKPEESPKNEPKAEAPAGTLVEKDDPEKKPEASPEPDTQEEKTVVRDEFEKDIKKIKELKIDTGSISLTPEVEEKVSFDTIPQECCSNCCQAPFYIQQGVRLSQEPLDLSGHYFNKRFADLSYSGIVKIDPKNKQLNKKYYPIKIITKKQFLRRRAIVKLKYDREKNPELRELRKVKWVYRFKNNSEKYSSFQKRTFSDIRIQYDPASNSSAIELKEKDKFCSITLKPKDPDGQIGEKMRNYRRVLIKRRNKFDIEEHARRLKEYSCFWAFNDKYFAREERGLSFKKWMEYFNTHLAQMHTRYDSLSKNMDMVIKDLACCENYKDSIGCGGFDTVPGGAKSLIREHGPNRILIIGLGIYNYDKVIPMNEQVFISSPQFVNSKGKKIKPKKSFLILGGLNGMLSFNSSLPLRLITTYKNTLFIVDQANRRYKIVIQGSENIQNHNNVFVLEDITAKTMNLKGLEKELLGK